MISNFKPERLVREGLKRLIPYDPGNYSGLVKLDANENPYDFPPGLMQQILDAAGPKTFNRYPDAMAVELINELAEWHKVEANQIMVGNGSDELILDLMLAFGAGNRVVIPVPTFSMYGIHATIAGAEIVEVARQDNFELDVDKIISSAEGAGLVVLCSPNNPTGNSAGTDQVVSILENCCCPVVVDQAYVDFGGNDFLSLLAEHRNLVIMRTFSKAFALAGLRVGYLLTHPEIVYYLLKVKQPFNLNGFSQFAALTALRNRDLFMQQVKIINEEKIKLLRALQEMRGVCVYPSDANFLLFETALPSLKVYKGLLQKNILIRNFGDPRLSKYLRVSVGLPDENKYFLHSLQQVIDTLGEKKSC
ncbi:histidinol-phosphate transaminase [Desulfotruncus alcoholivorax]|uniref:histidinol-phosphate transaminase n=1 Tax=Desulfotruncus alcoholivorax TaxID=265477 RepID=UPI00042780D2|nr:histidinol-phosphate transaminase [Desulfotruncus alcoholivorax]